MYDGVVLIVIYAAYLFLLSKLPPEEQEGIEDLERIPRDTWSPRPGAAHCPHRALLPGGRSALIYVTAEPFLGSLMALGAVLGVPSFVFIQWVAPFVSEFPEMASTFYWARTVTRAPMALMNMVSSNVNQWTLLTAMLPILYSFSRGSVSAIAFDERQKLELMMTIGQALVGMLFLINMELAWWEATVLFVLWVVQFALSAITPDTGGLSGGHRSIHWYIAITYFVWAGWELLRLLTGRRKPVALVEFAEFWRTHF